MPDVTARYNYTDEQGEVLYQVERLEPKGFRQRRLIEGRWAYNMEGQRRVLYRLPAVRQAIAESQTVYVTEGEKDADALVAIGKCATTAPGGAGKPFDEYVESLRGAKTIIVSDADDTGRRHALAVAQKLQGVASGLWVMEPREPHKDVAEHLEAGLKPMQLKLIDWRTKLRETAERATQLQVLTARQMMALPTPDKDGELLGPLLYRGHRVVIGGHTGHGKTTITLHMVAAATKGFHFLDWQGRGELRALVIDVEQGTRTVQRRLAETGLSESDSVSYLRVPDGLSLDVDRAAVRAMERVLVNGGYDIVLADPLYKLHRGDPNDSRAAVDLMRRFDEWRERFNFALLLPMHCRKPHPHSKLSVHDLFGSASYQWGAEVLMGIERKNSGFSLLHWWKDREGDLDEVGSQWQLAFSRESGYHRIKDTKTRVTTTERILDILRAHDAPMTSDEIRTALRQQIGDKCPGITGVRNALATLGVTNGVTHNGGRLHKDRYYQLPMSMFSADAALTGGG